MALTKVTGELVDIGDLDISNVGSIQLDSIAGDADSNTSITFSGSDVITVATGGSTAATFNADQTTTFSGAISGSSATLTTADNTDTLSLISTDADANQGPILNLYRNSSSPADSDSLGRITFDGKNDAGEVVEYARVFSKILDASDGTEDGTFTINRMVAGTSRAIMTAIESETVFNEAAQDIDFRVEGDTEQNLFFVDGSADKIGIGTNSPDRLLTLQGDNSYMWIKDAGGGNVGFIGGSGENDGLMRLYKGDHNAKVEIHSDAASYFNGGDVGIGTSSPSSKLTVTEAGDGNTPTMHIIDSADTEVAWFEGNRAGDTGAFIAVRHNPSSQAESNRSGIKFQADDDGGNVTNYAKITQYIEDNTNTTEDARLGINVMSDGSDNEVVNIRKDQFIYTGDAGSSFIRVDNRADGHDTGFEIYQNGTRRWEIHNDDSHDNQLDFRPAGNSEAMCIRSTGQVRIGVAPDIGGVLTVQKSNAGVPVLYAKNTNADSLGIRAEVNNNTSNNAIIEAINTDGTQWKIRNDGDHFGTDTSIGSISDSRLKKDVSDLTYDIAKFKQYRPVEFNWINPELHKSASGKTRGFLAQEIGAIDTYYVDKYDAEGDDVPLVDSDGKAHSTKFGYKDAMYISVIKQLITRIEALESA